jgi:hypothetical protein
MGNIPIINSEVSATTGIPNTRADAEAFGAGIGRALQGFGQQITGLGADIAEHQQRKASIEGQLALAQARQSMTDTLIQMENSDAAGSPEFQANYMAEFDKYEAAALDKLPNDPKVRDAFKVGMANLRASLGSRAMLTEATQAAAKTAGDAKNSLALGINTVAVDPSQYEDVIEEGKKLISTLNLPSNDRASTEAEFVDAVTAARFNALFASAKTPDAVSGVINDLKTGPWKEIMGEKKFADMLRIAESAQNDIAKLMKEQATAAIASVEDRITGNAVIDPMELADVGAQVKLAADPTLTTKWARLRAQYDTRLKVKGMSTPELRGYVEANKGSKTIIKSLPTEVSGRAAIARDFFVQRGFTPEQAAGIVGNLVQESGVRSNGPAGDSGTSFGMAQWRGERFTRLKRFAASRGRPWTDFQTQLEFIVVELQTHETGASNRLKSARTVEEATAAFIGYERPRGWSDKNPRGGHGWNNRLAAALSVSGAEPTATEFGFLRAEAAQDVLDEREKLIGQGNMMTAGQNAGLFTLQELTTPESFAERGRQSMVAADYLETNNEPFRPEELEAFEQVMASGTIEDKLALLENINAMGSVSDKAFEQIGEKTPLLGYVGGLTEYAPDTAREIMRGQQKLQENPDLKDVLTTGATGGTTREFFMVTQGALNSLPEVAHAARLAADALYIQRMGAAATGAFDTDTYAKAVRDVLGSAGDEGGVAADINGEPVVLPPGVTESDFVAMLNSLTPADLAEHSIGGGPPTYFDGTPAMPDDIAEEGRFRAVAVGAYTIYMADDRPLAGTGPNGFYVFQVDAKDVKKIVDRVLPEEGEVLSPTVTTPLGEMPAPIPGTALDRIMRGEVPE